MGRLYQLYRGVVAVRAMFSSQNGDMGAPAVSVVTAHDVAVSAFGGIFSLGTPSPLVWGGLFVLLGLRGLAAAKSRFERFWVQNCWNVGVTGFWVLGCPFWGKEKPPGLRVAALWFFGYSSSLSDWGN
jgi:hypothetical protein